MKNLDIFVLMPTGGGKSLCYQRTDLMAALTVIISPLFSFISDQLRALSELQLTSAAHLLQAMAATRLHKTFNQEKGSSLADQGTVNCVNNLVSIRYNIYQPN
jgi:superfamily II DNA helicase RecQ